MAGPLSGIKVVDCSAFITGPMAAMILGDQGADVIKVEPVGVGDYMRHLGTNRGGISTLFSGSNRSKRSIALNLRDDKGREIFLELIAEADVFIQNFRPGVVKRLGIDEEALREIKRDLVYVSISAFGQDGPWASKPAFDHVLQAATGFAYGQRDGETGEPGFVRHTVVDKLTALTVSQAITAALFHRAQTGEGQHVEMSMLGAALQFLWPDVPRAELLPGEGANILPALADTYRSLKVKDGYVVVAAVTPDQIHGSVRAIGRAELLDDPRFATIDALMQNIDAFQAETTGTMAELTVAECIAGFEREDVPCAPVLTPAEIIEHPQTKSQAFVEEVDHPAMGRLLQTRPPATFSRTPTQVERLAPALGADSRKILAHLGFAADEIDDLVKQGIVGAPN